MYESFYKLRKPPFRLTPDPHFFFESRTHKRGLAYLRYAVQQGEGFVVITGGPGTGKTELMLNLIEEQLDLPTVCAKIVSSNLNADDLLELVAASFGLTPEGLGKGAILKRLENYLIARVREGKQVLLLIDEAHNLSTTSLIELSMLSNFQLDEKALLQCFLLGQEPLEMKLQKPDLVHLKQRVIASTHLDPMDDVETRDYINHRLTQAGWKDDPHFHDNAYPLIHTFTGGIPRQINSFCSRLLLQGFIDEKHEIDIGVVHNVIAEVLAEVAVAHAPYTVSKPARDLTQRADIVNRHHIKPRASSEKTSASVTHMPTAQPAIADNTLDGVATYSSQAQMPQMKEPSTSVAVDKLHSTDLTTVHAGIKDTDALQELAHHGARRLLQTLTEDSQLDRELRASVAFFVNAGLANGTHHATANELSLLTSPSVLDSNHHPSSVWKWAVLAGISALVLVVAPQLRFTDGHIITRDTPSGETTAKLLPAATDSMPKAEQPVPTVMQINKNNTVVSGIPNAIDATQNSNHLATSAEAPSPEVVTALNTVSIGAAEQLVQKQNRMSEASTVMDQKMKTEHVPTTAALPLNTATPTTPAIPARQSNTQTTISMPTPIKQTPAKPVRTTKKIIISEVPAPKIQPRISTPATILPIPALTLDTPDEARPNHTASPTRHELQKEARLSGDPVKPAAEIGTAISHTELGVLVSTLTSAYEAGNLRKLVSVFADNARSNDSASIDEIENDYRQLFNVTDMRRMVISGIQWSTLKDQMRGEGSFQLYVREKGAGRITSYDGSILFDVMKSPQGILITQLNYQYDEQ